MICQSVDHRHLCKGSQFSQLVVLGSAHHDRIDITGQHTCGIRNGLTASDLHFVGRQHDNRPTELFHRDFE